MQVEISGSEVACGFSWPLVCLAAAGSMILGNLLMRSTGRPWDSFVQMDITRLPLGILTGMGFIGAGAIFHRENLVVGVTTAATLWFTIVMGFASAPARRDSDWSSSSSVAWFCGDLSGWKSTWIARGKRYSPFWWIAKERQHR